MPSSTDCWGIEVGSNAIKALRLQRSGASATVAEFDVIPFKKVLSTPDLDAEEAIRVGLDQFLSRHTIDKSTVVVSVPGHMAFARFAKLPPVEPKKVPDIVKFEAVQQIPFPIEQVEWDYQTFQFPDSPDVEVGIFAITKERIAKWLSNFASVQLPVHGVTLSPVAVYNALAYDMGLTPSSPAVVFMDIGTMATDLVIVDSGRLWLRTIPIGGHHFTEALVRSFKLNYSKAEKIKREAATSKYARQIFQSMRPVFVDLVNEVQKSMGYYQSSNREAELKQIVGLGSTFKLPGLQKFIKQQLQVEVSRLDTFKRLEIDARSAATFAENAVTMAPAYGLALQGLELEQVSANILPAQLIRQQVWGRKKVWAVAAAAAMVAAAAVPITRTMLDRAAVNGAAASSARAMTEQTRNDAMAQKTNYDNLGKIDPRPRIENLRGILDYRQLWPMVLDDLNKALASANPQPALLAGDVEAIRKIPRTDRNQILIQQVNYEYRAPAAQSSSAPAEGTPANTGPNRPTFTVTVVGTTTRGQGSAARFITETLVKTLRNADSAPHTPGKPERPYHITAVELREVAPIPVTAPANATGAPGSASTPSASTANTSATPLAGVKATPTAPAPANPQPNRPQVATKIEGSGAQLRNINDFLPSDPLAGEDRRDDNRFVLVFNVEIIRPEDKKAASPTPGNAPTASAEVHQ
jgi:type IV pilus assembly protein PilM